MMPVANHPRPMPTPGTILAGGPLWVRWVIVPGTPAIPTTMIVAERADKLMEGKVARQQRGGGQGVAQHHNAIPREGIRDACRRVTSVKREPVPIFSDVGVPLRKLPNIHCEEVATERRHTRANQQTQGRCE